MVFLTERGRPGQQDQLRSQDLAMGALSRGGQGSLLSLLTKGTSPKVTLSHPRLTWPPLPGYFQPCAPVNLEWPGLGAAQEIILAPIQSQIWIHSQPLQLCLRKYFWLLTAQTLGAKSCSALHCVSPVTFCLIYVMAGFFWPFILALEVFVKCQKLHLSSREPLASMEIGLLSVLSGFLGTLPY